MVHPPRYIQSLSRAVPYPGKKSVLATISKYDEKIKLRISVPFRRSLESSQRGQFPVSNEHRQLITIKRCKKLWHHLRAYDELTTTTFNISISNSINFYCF